MELQLSEKERMLLEDEKHHEELCVKKYQNYANQATDPELKELFNKNAQQEQQHYDTINQMLQGQQPNLSQGQNNAANQNANAAQNNAPNSSYQGSMSNEGDATLCTDMLATEKYISGTYDTTIFESANPSIRPVLQHIQKEEQKHGEDIFNYMNTHGMYNVQ